MWNFWRFEGLNVDTMMREPVVEPAESLAAFSESSMKTCAILKSILAKKHDADTEKTLLENLLINHESLITYRYKYRSTFEISSVLTLLLLLNEQNPAFSIAIRSRKLISRSRDYHPEMNST
ncbi:MAG: alpha-E domain-containing protein [Cyclobacteriaceae bacterium]|nr:alpha-E domain-containing protein [Cyclobacteriaceae bacterium]